MYRSPEGEVGGPGPVGAQDESAGEKVGATVGVQGGYPQPGVGPGDGAVERTRLLGGGVEGWVDVALESRPRTLAVPDAAVRCAEDGEFSRSGRVVVLGSGPGVRVAGDGECAGGGEGAYGRAALVEQEGGLVGGRQSDCVAVADGEVETGLVGLVVGVVGDEGKRAADGGDGAAADEVAQVEAGRGGDGAALDLVEVGLERVGVREAAIAKVDRPGGEVDARGEVPVPGLGVLSDGPVLQRDLQLPDSWWENLAGTLAKVAAVDTDRVAVRQQYMARAIPEFVGTPAPAVTCWSTAHSDLHWANVTAPLRILDWEGCGRAPEGFDAATLCAYSLLQEDVAARVRDAFPVLGSPAGLAAEATVCAQLLQTVARGDNLPLEDRLRDWSEELRRR